MQLPTLASGCNPRVSLTYPHGGVVEHFLPGRRQGGGVGVLVNKAQLRQGDGFLGGPVYTTGRLVLPRGAYSLALRLKQSINQLINQSRM